MKRFLDTSGAIGDRVYNLEVRSPIPVRNAHGGFDLATRNPQSMISEEGKIRVSARSDVARSSSPWDWVASHEQLFIMLPLPQKPSQAQ